ncbi:hypothetical protein EYF80_006881 [Liparis tanakae]|uniref:Uncharacterized protein n=1 Tax=Liparis tanakae TaxID=230148 RepID=A0A4Z2IZE4_9TELE|nr:hypothetical protein EYF80_006881 [Liparis tanakae]
MYMEHESHVLVDVNCDCDFVEGNGGRKFISSGVQCLRCPREVSETVPEAKGRTPVAELGVADPEERAVCGCEDAGPQHARPRYSFQSLSSLGRGGQALTLGSGSRGADGLRLIAAFALFGRTSVVVAHHLLLNPRGLPSAAGGVVKRRAWLLFVWKCAVYRSLIGGDVWLLALLIEGVPDAFGGLVLSFLCCTCILHKSCRCGGRQRFDTVSVVLTGFGFQWSQ